MYWVGMVQCICLWEGSVCKGKFRVHPTKFMKLLFIHTHALLHAHTPLPPPSLRTHTHTQLVAETMRTAGVKIHECDLAISIASVTAVDIVTKVCVTKQVM